MNFHEAEPSHDETAELIITKFSSTPNSLAYTRYTRKGADPTKRVVLLHGFTQSSASFTEISCKLALGNGLEVLSIDLPYHGGSAKVEADLTQAADLLLQFGKNSIWVGYSLGARHLLAMCLSKPEFEWNAIFSGLNPGITDPTERSNRYSADVMIADQLHTISGDAVLFKHFLQRWTSQGIFQPRSLRSEDMDSRLINNPDALAKSLRSSSIGKQEDYWPRVHELKGNFVFINGGEDTKYLEIANEMRRALAPETAADFRIIPGLGHSAIFDRPNILIKAIVDLSQNDFC